MSVYVAAPLCSEAEQNLRRQGGSAGDVRARVVCLAPVEGDGRFDLAAVGANARRATEDSSSVAYVEAPGPTNRFAEPILEEAGVAFLGSSSGEDAMARVLRAIRDAGPSRDAVHEELNET